MTRASCSGNATNDADDEDTDRPVPKPTPLAARAVEADDDTEAAAAASAPVTKPAAGNSKAEDILAMIRSRQKQ